MERPASSSRGAPVAAPLSGLERGDIGADHVPGEGRGGLLLRIDARHQAPKAQDRRVVAEAFHLLQAM